jgi:hypothetical protein
VLTVGLEIRMRGQRKQDFRRPHSTNVEVESKGLLETHEHAAG